MLTVIDFLGLVELIKPPPLNLVGIPTLQHLSSPNAAENAARNFLTGREHTRHTSS
jgi:hypothetical protein